MARRKWLIVYSYTTRKEVRRIDVTDYTDNDIRDVRKIWDTGNMWTSIHIEQPNIRRREVISNGKHHIPR